MGHFVLTNAKLWVARHDLSGDLNQIGIEAAADLREAHTFGSNGWKERRGGLRDGTLQSAGYWNGGEDAIDDVLFARLGVAGEVVSASPFGGAEGDVAYTLLAAFAQYAPGASLGELLAFTVNAEGASPLVRGTVMRHATLTTSGQSTARQLGTVSASQRLYAALHVLAVEGTDPTLDVVVRSDDTGGMSSPVARITFNQQTAPGSQWAAPVAGPVTDGWWDIDCTLGGTDDPAFTVVVIVGIQ